MQDHEPNGPYTTPDKKDFARVICDNPAQNPQAATAFAAVIYPRPTSSNRLSPNLAYATAMMHRNSLEKNPHPNGQQNSQPQQCPDCGNEIGPGRPGRRCKPCRNGETAHLPKKPEPIKIFVGTPEGIDHAIDQAKAEQAA